MITIYEEDDYPYVVVLVGERADSFSSWLFFFLGFLLLLLFLFFLLHLIRHRLRVRPSTQPRIASDTVRSAAVRGLPH